MEDSVQRGGGFTGTRRQHWEGTEGDRDRSRLTLGLVHHCRGPVGSATVTSTPVTGTAVSLLNTVGNRRRVGVNVEPVGQGMFWNTGL